MTESSGISRDFPDQSFSDSDTLIESDTETKTETDSSYSESDCDEDVQINLHEASITNTDNSTEKNDDWIQVLNRDADQGSSHTVFSPVNPPGPVNCIPEDSLPHEYFLHLFGEDFVDLLVKEPILMETTRFRQKEQYQKVLIYINGILQTEKSCLHF